MVRDDSAVFVVHGRNDAMRKSMFGFLRAIGLSPLEWNRAVELTGSAAPYIGEVLDAAFDRARAVVVLLTPDEVAYLDKPYAYGPDDPEIQSAPQARPNVLFEAGMAMGRDAKRTVLVEVGAVRPFSDVAGRHAIRMNNSVASRQELANRLRTAGCTVDITGTDWHSSGDFTPPPPPGGGQALGRRVPSAAASRPVDFDLKYIRRASNQLHKLQIINRGTEAVYDVTVTVPENAALDTSRVSTIAKIPGGGSRSPSTYLIDVPPSALPTATHRSMSLCRAAATPAKSSHRMYSSI